MGTAADRLIAGAGELGRTDALVMLRGGEVVLERYGPGVGRDTTLRSWSMAKSILHAAVGILVDQGVLDLDAPAPVPEWQGSDDPRGAITLGHLMTMRAGLAWVEEGAEAGLPDSVTMVYGNDGGPMPDTAAWAADRPLVDPPGSVLAYSSGSSAIVSRIVRDAVGGADAYDAWLRTELFDRVGMTSARPRFDPSGTWMASSFCFCTARDFARFGQLYLDAGTVGGERVLSGSWVSTASHETGRDRLGRIHTMHWWRFGDTPWGAFHASGYLGQYLVVVPTLDAVLVRTGETATEHRPAVEELLVEVLAGASG